MAETKYNPWVRKAEKLGFAQAGTFVYGKTDANGITAKHAVDDVTVNRPLVPPPDAENAALVAGINIVVEMDTNYKPTVLDDGRLRTCEFVIRTMASPLTPGTYGTGAKTPDSGQGQGQGPKS